MLRFVLNGLGLGKGGGGGGKGGGGGGKGGGGWHHHGHGGRRGGWGGGWYGPTTYVVPQVYNCQYAITMPGGNVVTVVAACPMTLPGPVHAVITPY